MSGAARVRIYEDLRVVQSRLAVLQAARRVPGRRRCVVQFWNLQVVRARHFRELAENNRSRLVTLAAPRGALLDRNGPASWSGNRPSFSVVLNTERAEGLDRVAARIAETLARRRSRRSASGSARRQPYRPVVLKTDATLADVAALEARRFELPEVSVEVVPLRSYPLASAAAHALGRVGEITRAPAAAARVPARSRAGSLVGPGRASSTATTSS